MSVSAWDPRLGAARLGRGLCPVCGCPGARLRVSGLCCCGRPFWDPGGGEAALPWRWEELGREATPRVCPCVSAERPEGAGPGSSPRARVGELGKLCSRGRGVRSGRTLGQIMCCPHVPVEHQDAADPARGGRSPVASWDSGKSLPLMTPGPVPDGRRRRPLPAAVGDSPS